MVGAIQWPKSLILVDFELSETFWGEGRGKKRSENPELNEEGNAQHGGNILVHIYRFIIHLLF